jgi:hypothetical protein
VERLVVLEVVEEGERRAVRVGGEEDGGAGHPRRRVVSISATNRSSGVAVCEATKRINSVPRFQVVVRRKTPPAMTSGTQPPSSILIRLAAKKAPSTARKTPAMRPAATGDQRHRRRATTYRRIVVMVIVPVTAVPYAEPSALEEPKPTTSSRQPTMSAALTSGT